MSLILEALRKSEAERRRAQAPDLFAPAQVAVAPVRRLPPARLLLAGAVLLVVAIVAARGLWPTPSANDAAEGDVPRDASRSASAATPAGPAPAQPMSAAADPASASPSPSAPSPSQPAAPRLLPVPAAPAPSIAAEDAGSPAPADAGITPSAATAIARANERPDAIQATPAAPALPAPAATEAAAPPMRLSELAGDARRQLPPLKLTMHMWNEAADRRFVILDGRRLVEGDRIGAAQVAEIRRDGVLLDWNGQRLELPLH